MVLNLRFCCAWPWALFAATVSSDILGTELQSKRCFHGVILRPSESLMILTFHCYFPLFLSYKEVIWSPLYIWNRRSEHFRLKNKSHDTRRAGFWISCSLAHPNCQQLWGSSARLVEHSYLTVLEAISAQLGGGRCRFPGAPWEEP